MTNRPATAALASRNGVLAVAVTFAMYMFGWTTHWSFDPTRELGPPSDWFFTAQADAILRGRLWVDAAALSPGALTVTGSECFWSDGQCFGYWGLTPSLLRLPLLLIFGTFAIGLVEVMISLASGVALFAALDLCRQNTNGMTAKQASGFMVMAAVALGPGSVLVFLADPYVYQEAIVWSVALVLVAINLFWRWYHGGSNHLLIGVALGCTFAAGARPTTMFVGPVLAAAVVLKLRSDILVRRLVLTLTVVLVVTPAFFALGVYYAKFGQISTPAETYNNPTGAPPSSPGVCEAPANEISVENLPTNLLAYLRPDSARIVLDASPVRFRFSGCGSNAPTLLWPRNSYVGVYPEKHTSITTAMPLATIATVWATAVAIRRRRWIQLFLLVATASSLTAVFLVPVITARYLGDFYPLVVVGLALSAGIWSRDAPSKPRTLLVGVALVSLAWSVVAVASLLTRYAWLYQW